MLPMLFVTGAGIGFCISTLSSAASAYLPPTRFAMGSALQSTNRQIAAAIGSSVAISLLTSLLVTIGMARYKAQSAIDQLTEKIDGFIGAPEVLNQLKTQRSALIKAPVDFSQIQLHPFYVSWYLVSVAAALTAITMLVLFKRPTDEQLAASSVVTFID
jgi:hypothetical protein